MCYRFNEDGGHLFLKCKKVKQVWRMMLLEEVRIKLMSASSPMAMFELIQSLPTEQSTPALLLLWVWWTTRNKTNAGEREKSTEEVCHSIHRYLIDFQSDACTGKTNQNVSSVPVCRRETWTKPAHNLVKVNVDAAFRKETADGAWGFVVRSDAGEYIAAAAGKLRYLKDALQAEAEACVAATEGASALGLNRVIFESDCRTLVTALKTHSHDLSPIGVLLQEIRSNCISSFETFEFRFAPRSCNSVAHSLAQYGLHAETDCSAWEGSAPVFVSVLVASDVAVQCG